MVDVTTSDSLKTINIKRFFTPLVILIQAICVIFSIEKFSIILIALLSIVVYFSVEKSQRKSTQSDLSIPTTIIYVLAFQNLVIGISAHLSNNVSNNLVYITQSATVIIYVTTLFIFLNKKLNGLDFCFCLLIFMMLISMCFSREISKLVGIINYFRNFSAFYCCYLIGKKYICDKAYFIKLMEKIFKLCVVLCVIGIVFNFMPFSFMEALGIKEVYIAKGAPITSNTYSGRLTTGVFGREVKRIGSVMFEPINFGYFLIPAILYSFIKIKKEFVFKNLIALIIILIGFLTTYAKGPFLLVGMLVASYIVYYVLKNIPLFKRSNNLLFIALLLIFIVGLTVFSIYYYKTFGGAVNNHFWAIERTFKNCLSNPLGYGLGTGGNYGSQLDGWLESGSESGLMTALYQMGFPFTILFIGMFVEISRRLTNNGTNFLFAFLALCLIVMSIFQENTFSPQCLGLIMIISGALSNESRSEDWTKKGGLIDTEKNSLLLVREGTKV